MKKESKIKEAFEIIRNRIPTNKLQSASESISIMQNLLPRILTIPGYEEISAEEVAAYFIKNLNKFSFKPRARLLVQLGDQLIKNEGIALLELVKNSYDADSTVVIVELFGISDPQSGRIVIMDDGEGMDEDTIWNSWMEPGSDNKRIRFEAGLRTPKFKRLPIGEKGIGRFGVHKLGRKIELVTRRKDCDEIKILIDWNAVEKERYLDDAMIVVESRKAEIFLGDSTGTQMVIQDLRGIWDRRTVRSVYKNLFSLSSPFESIDSFKILFEIDKQEWVDDLPKFEDMNKYSLYYFKCEMEGSRIVEFEYEFRPWITMDKVAKTEVYYCDRQIKPNGRFEKNINSDFIANSSLLKGKNPDDRKKEVIIDLGNHKIGVVKFEGYIFDLDRSILDLSTVANKSLITKYLKENGGIRIYRDGIRLNEYGMEGNDWLNLDIRRVNVPVKRISNNLIIAQVVLEREGSSDLIEKTNREGFVENEAFKDLAAAILFVVDKVETYRNIDKSTLREAYVGNKANEPVLFEIGELRNLIEDRVKDVVLQREMISSVNRIESQYEEINEILLASASAGLNLGIAVHEIQKVIRELSRVLTAESSDSKPKELTKRLSELVDGYVSIIGRSEKKVDNLRKIVEAALFNSEFRLLNHGIALITPFRARPEKFLANFSFKLILGSLLNIIDNAIYWLEDRYEKEKRRGFQLEKKLFLDIQEEREHFVIVVADNGDGIKLPLDKIIRPFVSGKSDGMGMGLGLHIAHEVMRLQDGKLLFPEPGDYDIPKEFWKGAILGLKIKRSI